jgi:hypothetical protein
MSCVLSEVHDKGIKQLNSLEFLNSWYDYLKPGNASLTYSYASFIYLMEEDLKSEPLFGCVCPQRFCIVQTILQKPHLFQSHHL